MNVRASPPGDLKMANETTSMRYAFGKNWAEFIEKNFSVAWAAWVADYLDPKNFLMLGATGSGVLNNGAYSNPKFDALIARSDTIANPRARGECLAEAEQIVLDDAAFAPIYFGVTRTLVSPAVRGWVDNAVNIHRTRWLSLDRNRALA